MNTTIARMVLPATPAPVESRKPFPEWIYDAKRVFFELSDREREDITISQVDRVLSGIFRLVRKAAYLPTEGTVYLASESEMARAIADEAARSDIECHCVWTSSRPEDRWYDTSTIEDQESEKELRGVVDRAVMYLELRGLLVRQKGAPHIVQVQGGMA